MSEFAALDLPYFKKAKSSSKNPELL